MPPANAWDWEEETYSEKYHRHTLKNHKTTSHAGRGRGRSFSGGNGLFRGFDVDAEKISIFIAGAADDEAVTDVYVKEKSKQKKRRIKGRKNKESQRQKLRVLGNSYKADESFSYETGSDHNIQAITVDAPGDKTELDSGGRITLRVRVLLVLNPKAKAGRM